MLAKLSVEGFVEELASNSPAPGGGSAAALSGAMAAALVAMVARLTIGKDKYKDAEKEMKNLLPKADALWAKLLESVDLDTGAFNDVMVAFKLPKETERQKEIRSEAIQTASRRAAEVPLNTAFHCLEVLRLAPAVAAKGNTSAASDAGVAAHLAYVGLQGAALNVKINLGSIKDAEFTKGIRAKLDEYLTEGEALRQQVEKSVIERLGA